MSETASETGFQIICGILFTIYVTIMIVKLSKRSMHRDIRARDVTKGHRWCYTGMFSRPSYCNNCETLIMASDGAFCDSCGVCADSPSCIHTIDKAIPCKPITTEVSTLKHQWVKGNLPFEAHCEACEKECGTEPELIDFRCCWCQRYAHEDCIKNLSVVCDLGKRNDCIVPPNCIVLKTSHSRIIRKQLLIKKVYSPKIYNWSPTIVVGNQKSGSSECSSILSSFRRILNPAQVLDLAQHPPEEALEWCDLVPDFTCRIIVAGGDGTIGWVFDAIHKLKLKREPMVAILPLGTGNDLSRVMGFGEGHNSDVDVEEYLDQLSNAVPTKLDRWKVNYTPCKHLGIRMPAREVFMNNYLSIGVDALVTLNFHRARQSPFYIFSNRLINKLLYFTFGTKDVLEHECKNLDKRLDLYMDDKKIELPSLEAVVVLNIETWGAGVRPWTLGAGGATAPKQDPSDGLLEVFCLVSSFHIAQLQVGLSEPIRLGQCSKIKIVLKGNAPMQVDGEPWEQTPGNIVLTHSHQASLLKLE